MRKLIVALVLAVCASSLVAPAIAGDKILNGRILQGGSDSGGG